MDQNNPKYAFGLLVTPSSSTAITSGGEESSSTTIKPVPLNLAQIKSKYERLSRPASSLLQTPSTSGQPARSSLTSSSTLRRPPSLLTTPAIGGLSSARSRTPGSRRTPSSTSIATGEPRSLVVAVMEGFGELRYRIGVAAIDLRRPVLMLSQFEDRQNYGKILAKLHFLQPVEILMPNTAFEGRSRTRLFQIITEAFSDVHIATVTRNYFDDTKGLQYIKKLVIPELSAVEHEIKSKFLCTAATSALLRYVEFIQNMVFAPSSVKVIYRGLEQTTQIDVPTIKNLELLQNAWDGTQKGSLFGVLNGTKTKMGARRLRANILQPSNNLEVIECHQDAIQELLDSDATQLNLQHLMARFLDIDHLIALCVQIPKQETMNASEAMIDHIIHLKHCLELVKPLSDAVAECTNPLFRAYHQKLQDDRFEEIHQLITMVIEEDTKYHKNALSMRTQKCFAVKPNINGHLDVARRTYTEIVDDVSELVEQLSEEHGLALRSACTTSRGFHVTLPVSAVPSMDDLRPVFIKVTRSKHLYSFTCETLIALNDRIAVSLHEIFHLTNIIVSELMKDIRDKLGCMYELAEIVAMIDMLVALAHNSRGECHVRPEFTDTLALKQSLHPILCKIGKTTPVANNVYASDDSNFIVLTGPNMAGKSTYLRQIALLQILAQMGTFVPAEYASFRLAGQIFSRIGNDDDPESNLSTFTVEMKEINYIVQNMTNNSLIIIDELGRGTSADEGVGISFALCEYLLRFKAFTFLATHFKQLTTLDTLYPNVENYHFEVQHVVNDRGLFNKMTFTHVVSKGRTKEKLYGLKLAEMSTLPKAIVEKAKAVSADILKTYKSNEAEEEARERRAVFKLGQRLIQTARNSELDQTSLRGYLQSLKALYYCDLQSENRETDTCRYHKQ